MEENNERKEQNTGKEENPRQRETFIEGLKSWADSIPNRSAALMGLVGAYLIYTGYSLIVGFVRGEESSGWIFVLFAVIFILIAIFFLYVCFHVYSRRTKEQKQAQEEIQQLKAEIPEAAGEVQAETAGEKALPPEEEETGPAEPEIYAEIAADPAEPVQKKSSGMTLAERAALANSAEDEKDIEE